MLVFPRPVSTSPALRSLGAHSLRRFALPALFAIGICAGGASTARAADCARSHGSLSSDGTTYVAQFFDPGPYTGRLDATFYTATSEYAATLPALAIDEPAQSGFRSKEVAFWNPGPEPLLGVAFTYGGAGEAGPCTERGIIVPRAGAPALARRQARTPGSPPPPGTIPLELAGNPSPLPCTQPFVPARIHGVPADAAYPAIARELGATGVVKIKVEIEADGSVWNAAVYESSGNALLDGSALRAALQSRYDPEVFRCEPEAGTYLFRVDFVGGR
jgi:TonB family protein